MIAIERARPWLGTLVSVRVEAADQHGAQKAIEAAFAEIAHVHQCMSFHHHDSDLGRLMQEAHERPIMVDPYTFHVLSAAHQFAKVSKGIFDITLGGELTRYGLLPDLHPVVPSEITSWTDIELLPNNQVFFRRRLLIDLGGIAKGYAVDCAIEKLKSLNIKSALVNAGGDLRVFGESEELILLNVPGLELDRPSVHLKDGSLASSCITDATHWNGSTRLPLSSSRFVSVAAPQCMTADALTKIVLCQGNAAEETLRSSDAQACLFERDGSGWTCQNLNAPQSAI